MAQTIAEAIVALNDGQAIRLLLSVARATASVSPEPGTQVLREVAATLPLPEVSDSQAIPSDGEAARAALMLLAENEHFAEPIRALLAGPPPTKMDLGIASGTLLTAGLLLALQTHFKFERLADGKLIWKIEKKPTNNVLLSALVKKLLSHLK